MTEPSFLLARRRLFLGCAAGAFLPAVSLAAPGMSQPRIAVRSKPLLRVDGLLFRDLDGSGELVPFKDWRRPPVERARDLIGRMTIEEKAGLMMHASLGAFVGKGGEVLERALDADQPSRLAATITVPGFSPEDRPSPRTLVEQLQVRFLMLGAEAASADLAAWANRVQALAENSRLGIPAVVSAERRNLARRRDGRIVPPGLSWWPSEIGLAATGDVGLAERFGALVGAEYRALGWRMTLGPQIDLATEPRWTRIDATFGEDIERVTAYGGAMVRGWQGRKIGPDGVLAVAKHWPGGGPLKDGLDSHNTYGRLQVYPGGGFDIHLKPFRAAMDAGVAAIMPSYGIAEGKDDVAMAFSKVIVRDLLRGRFGYDGIVLSDWLRAMPWGVEALSMADRQRLMLEAGVDQFGGEHDPSWIVGLVRSGRLPETRLDESVRRLLLPMFAMGLFENPYVEEGAAVSRVVNGAAARAAGLEARRRSVTIIKNDGVLPLRPAQRIWSDRIDAAILRDFGTVAATPDEADVVLTKADAPYQVHKGPGAFFKGKHEGSLAYAGADNAAELERIKRLCGFGKPVVVFLYLDRPAVVSEFDEDVGALVIDFNVGDSDLLAAVYGRTPRLGTLPFNLPNSMDDVLAQRPDLPDDLPSPRYPRGFGLSLSNSATR
jgi:beta-glucosidase